MKQLITLGITLLFCTTTFAQNDFAFKLQKQMDTKKNLLFSPISIKIAFAMAYEGANNATQKEFESVFGFQANNQTFIKEMQELKKVAAISNSIWIQDNFTILDSYIKAIRKNFGSSPTYTDFMIDPEGSAKKINQWIEKSTNGMIQKMVTPDDVKAFKMALVNAIYFKEDWLYAFDKNKTEKNQDFHNISGPKSKVDLMYAYRNFRAKDGKDEKVIELPYKGGRTSMIVIMPENMKRYELNEKKYNELINGLYNQDVKFHLPVFSYETPTFELKDYLMAMGMQETFSNSADFSGMRKERDLKIGTALHKAKIIVNEEGTEAAAATVVGMVLTTSVSTREPIIMEMRVDKPFYYFIRDNQTNTILFMGQITEL